MINDALIVPRHIVVVGASSDVHKPGGKILKYSLFTNGHLNLATCLQLEGPVEAALAAYAAAGRSDSLALYRANINHEWGVALVRAVPRPGDGDPGHVGGGGR